ncbi:MAG: hypothetical protein GWN32_01885, partial [Gemmatimonadetes bacterium]|nr:hypothetical protein [Gemmatimonadota bacterium]
MEVSVRSKLHGTHSIVIAMLGLIAAAAVAQEPRVSAEHCDPRIELPKGFCAIVFADAVGRARHITV